MQANSGDPDQTPHSVASDLGLHYLPMSHKMVVRHIWLKMQLFCLSQKSCRDLEVCCTNNLRGESALGTSDLSKFINLYQNTLNKTRKRETVSYNKTIDALFFG